MLNQLLGKNRESIEISKERIKEIFEVPKTKEKWEKILQNSKFRKMMIDSSEKIQDIVGKTLTKNQIIEGNIWKSKTTILKYALFFIANEGISFNKGVQKSCDFILREIESTSEEEVEEIMQQFFESLFRQITLQYNNSPQIFYTDTIM